MNMSPDIKEIAIALSKVQSQLINPKKGSENPFFKSKYSDLSEVWEAIRKPLTDAGLSVLQCPESINGEVIIKTLLLHNSGQFIETDLSLKPVKTDPQGIGSCITYGRRYALQSIIGISPEDDDGNKASGLNGSDNNNGNGRKTTTTEKPQNNSQQKPSNPSPKNSTLQKPANGISEKQNKRMFALANGNKDLIDIAVKEAGYTSSTQIEWQKYEQICNRISELVINPPQKDISDEFCDDMNFEDVPF